MTYAEKIKAIWLDPAWSWTAQWWRLGEIIVATPAKAWATKDPDETCPPDVTALGCGGLNAWGIVDWIGFDLDVGHGKLCYQSSFVAEQAAKMLWSKLGPATEIRRSKSGLGLHVRSMIPYMQDIPEAKIPEYAKGIANELGLRADPTALSRQRFWLWCDKPKPKSFALVQAATLD